MGRKTASLRLAPVFALALAACGGGKETVVDPNIPPTAFKQEILDTLSKTLDDPTNVREASLSDPVLAPVGPDQRYMACVRYNARDLNHSYVGVKERIAYFYGGHLNQLVWADKGQCSNAAYKPFPELEKLCLAKKCN